VIASESHESPERLDAPQGFEEFAGSVSQSLMRLAFARAGTLADAEDLVQEALITAHEKWDVVGFYDEPLLWVRRIMLNKSVSRWRRRTRERDAVTRMTDRRPEEGATEPVLADEELWTAVRGLGGRQRDVVLLLWFEDLSVREVASILGCGEETVRTHWRRARAKLADELGEHNDLEDGRWR
jgi:RNA polymerase sigma-70 factor (sigma-E family)